MGEEEKLIGKKEIEAIFTDKKRKFNISVLEEGIRQAELRLKDVNAMGDMLEKRAYNLLYFYSSLTVAFVSLILVLVSLYTSDTTKISYIYYFLLGGLSVVVILTVITYVFKVFNSLEYGILGRPPNTWLGEGVIEGDDNTKGYVLANILYDYQKKIEISEGANQKIKRLLKDAGKTLVFLLLLFSILGAIYISCKFIYTKYISQREQN